MYNNYAVHVSVPPCTVPLVHMCQKLPEDFFYANVSGYFRMKLFIIYLLLFVIIYIGIIIIIIY